MGKHFDVVASRLKNMLTRIASNNSDFEDLCSRHADLTKDIRMLNTDADIGDQQRDQQLRRRRAALETEMLAIMQSNTRV